MASTRHKKNSTSAPGASKAPAKKIADAEYIKRINYLRKNKVAIDPTNRKATNAKYIKTVRRAALEENYTIKASADQRAELKKRGFVTTKKGVLIDTPRDRKREHIKGVRTEILKDGVVKMSVKQRSDFIFGLTKKQKKEYAENPELFTKKILKDLRDKYPSAKGGKSQVRLQWGVFSGNKDFSATYFSKKYFTTSSPEQKRRRGKKKAGQRIDNLTGIRVIVHKTGTGKNAKRKAKRKK